MPSDVEIEIAQRRNSAATLTGQLGLYELKTGDILAGRFQIESLLGVGGMGMVYRATDQSLGVEVAIKLLRSELARKPESFERFRQELLLARQVSSRHVVRIHDIAQDAGRWFISMDYIDGQSLEHRLDGAPRLPTQEVLAITHDLLDGLNAAHQAGVVHRDLKPANILIDHDNCAFITDFGVARSIATTGMTHTGMIVGTPEYLSPEQARGEKVDARSDLYTAGLIVYEMLAGQLPFSGGTPAESVMQRILRPPPSLTKIRPDLPRWLNAFVDRLLKLNPAHRFATTADALRALQSRRVPRPPLNRHAILVTVLALAAAVAAINWAYRHVPNAAQIATTVPAIPQLAVLPFSTSADNADQIALARALTAHLQTWLRSDSAIGIIPRRRVLHAIARSATDLHGKALLQLLPAIANAATASRIAHAELGADDKGLTLHLSLADMHIASLPHELNLRGKSAAALFDAYTAALPAFLANADMHVGAPPTLNAANILDYGRALIAMDSHDEQTALKILSPIASTTTDSALLAAATLQAELSAKQAAQTQASRAQITQQFAHSKQALALQLYASALSAEGRDDEAGHVLETAIQAYPNDAELILAEAEHLRSTDKRDAAMALLKRYLNSANDDAHAWFALGRTAIESGDARTAVENYLLHALTLNTLANDSSAQAQTRNAIGIGYERLGQLEAAAEQYQRAVTIRERLGEKSELAKSLRNLAIVQAEQGRREQAQITLEKAKVLLESLGDRASIAYLYNDRGVVAEETGDFGEALKFYRQAYALRQQLNDPAALAESLNNIGFCSYRMGAFDNASVYWKQALSEYQQLGDRNSTLHIQQSMALLDIAHGRFTNAHQTLTESLTYAREHQLPEEAAVANISLAELALLEGRFVEAGDFANQAAQIFSRRSDERGGAEASLLQARSALAMGDSRSAAKLIAAIDPKRLNDEQTAQFQIASAAQFELTGDLQGRAAKLDAAAKSAARAHSGTLVTRIALAQVRLALARGQVRKAITQLKTIRQQKTRLGEVPIRLEWLELEMATAIRNHQFNDAKARYHEVLPVLKGVARYADAGILHRLGARAFADNKLESASAEAAANAAQTQLLNAVPASSRAMLQTRLNQRWVEEIGNDGS